MASKSTYLCSLTLCTSSWVRLYEKTPFSSSSSSLPGKQSPHRLSISGMWSLYTLGDVAVCQGSPGFCVMPGGTSHPSHCAWDRVGSWPSQEAGDQATTVGIAPSTAAATTCCIRAWSVPSSSGNRWCTLVDPSVELAGLLHFDPFLVHTVVGRLGGMWQR